MYAQHRTDVSNARALAAGQAAWDAMSPPDDDREAAAEALGVALEAVASPLLAVLSPSEFERVSLLLNDLAFDRFGL